MEFTTSIRGEIMVVENGYKYILYLIIYAQQKYLLKMETLLTGMVCYKLVFLFL